MMPTKLNEAACDIGCLAISKDEILIFGGWNRSPLQNAYILKKIEVAPALPPSIVNGVPQSGTYFKHELKMIEGGLEKADFFLLTGVAMKTDVNYQIKVCGHTQLFTFDLKQKKFVASSSV